MQTQQQVQVGKSFRTPQVGYKIVKATQGGSRVTVMSDNGERLVRAVFSNGAGSKYVRIDFQTDLAILEN